MSPHKMIGALFCKWGHVPGQGCGKNNQGRLGPITVRPKNNTMGLGLGYRPTLEDSDAVSERKDGVKLSKESCRFVRS